MLRAGRQSSDAKPSKTHPSSSPLSRVHPCSASLFPDSVFLIPMFPWSPILFPHRSPIHLSRSPVFRFFLCPIHRFSLSHLFMFPLFLSDSTFLKLPCLSDSFFADWYFCKPFWVPCFSQSTCFCYHRTQALDSSTIHQSLLARGISQSNSVVNIFLLDGYTEALKATLTTGADHPYSTCSVHVSRCNKIPQHRDRFGWTQLAP